MQARKGRATSIETGEEVYREYLMSNEEYKINPNMTLDGFYNTLNMENYTIEYTEPLTVI